MSEEVIKNIWVANWTNPDGTAGVWKEDGIPSQDFQEGFSLAVSLLCPEGVNYKVEKLSLGVKV